MKIMNWETHCPSGSINKINKRLCSSIPACIRLIDMTNPQICFLFPAIASKTSSYQWTKFPSPHRICTKEAERKSQQPEPSVRAALDAERGRREKRSEKYFFTCDKAVYIGLHGSDQPVQLKRLDWLNEWVLVRLCNPTVLCGRQWDGALMRCCCALWNREILHFSVILCALFNGAFIRPGTGISSREPTMALADCFHCRPSELPHLLHLSLCSMKW